MSTTQQQARWIRVFRWLHRKIALALFIFFIIMAFTGLLLGIKKQAGLQAPTRKGMSADPAQWMSINALHTRAQAYLKDSVEGSPDATLDRIDIRTDKGIAKFIYLNHYKSLQIDCTTGAILSVEQRGSDFIEDLHDGSILDKIIGTSDEEIMIGYTVIMGISLLLLIVSGMWLWYGPRRIRRQKQLKT